MPRASHIGRHLYRALVHQWVNGRLGWVWLNITTACKSEIAARQAVVKFCSGREFPDRGNVRSLEYHGTLDT